MKNESGENITVPAKLPAAVHTWLQDKQGKILMMKRQNTWIMDWYWSLPVWKLDAGESMSQCSVRETLEETSIRVLQFFRNPLLIHHHNEKWERLYAFFKTENYEWEAINMEPKKCSEMCWVFPNNLPEPVVPVVKFAIDRVLSGEEGWYVEFWFEN